MKPWEETWFADASSIERPPNDGGFINPIGRMLTDYDDYDGASVARARFAAAAPDMARVLLRFVEPTKDPCPGCGKFGPMAHTDRCTLMAALRKAGVIP